MLFFSLSLSWNDRNWAPLPVLRCYTCFDTCKHSNIFVYALNVYGYLMALSTWKHLCSCASNYSAVTLKYLIVNFYIVWNQLFFYYIWWLMLLFLNEKNDGFLFFAFFYVFCFGSNMCYFWLFIINNINSTGKCLSLIKSKYSVLLVSIFLISYLHFFLRILDWFLLKFRKKNDQTIIYFTFIVFQLVK